MVIKGRRQLARQHRRNTMRVWDLRGAAMNPRGTGRGRVGGQGGREGGVVPGDGLGRDVRAIDTWAK